MRRQGPLLPSLLLRTQGPLQSWSCVVRQEGRPAMTGFSVCCWTGDSRGQRFTVPAAPSLSSNGAPQRKGLMRTTRKHRGSWQRRRRQQRPFPSHPEGQQSSSVAARGAKQGAHCDINTDCGGWRGAAGVKVTPWVVVSYREAHCEEVVESGGGGGYGANVSRTKAFQSMNL